jgi:soluble lytic murein transglycosylase-like protein
MVSIRQVVGRPVPGLSGVRGHGGPAAVPFGRVLAQMRGAAAKASVPVRHASLPPVLRRPASIAPGSARAVGRSLPSSAPLPAGRQQLAATIRRAAAEVGVEPALAVGVARAESSLNPAARSSDGLSVGTFQMTRPTTADMRRRFATGVVDRPAAGDDVALGVGYLRYLQDLFARGGRLGRGLNAVAIADASERRLFTVAAFNAGEGRVSQAQARAAAVGLDPTRFAHVRPFLPRITQTYVERVTSYARQDPENLRA